jgi:zinc/manganese transport system substrate-binding protein
VQRTTKVVVAVAVALLLVGVGVYAVLTSSAPSSACPANPAPASAVAAGGPRGTGLSPPRSTPPFAPSASPRAPTRPAPRVDGIETASTTGVIPVVAAENFWGSLVSQLGGNRTSVVSIITDPNADPHEYEANSTAATEISDARLVIVNGVGYDDWALQLIAADGQSGQLVLNVGDLNGPTVGGGIVTGNPHMWYNPVFVNATVAAMYSDLVAIQPASTAYFQQQYATLNVSLASLYGEASDIKAHFAGTEVASTESIFVYLANFTDLDLVSPPAFMEAVAEGNDPPAQSVVDFQCQLESGDVRVMVYNEQTVTPITTEMKSIAAAHNVSLVGVTETIQPPGVEFQTWMLGEYLALYNALNAKALGE